MHRPTLEVTAIPLNFTVSFLSERDKCFNGTGHTFIIGIKHVFLCINIRQVPWEVLKTEAEGRGFQHHPRHLANVNALKKKNMFNRYYCIKTENICHISRYFLHYFVSPFPWCLANAIFSRTMLVLGPSSTHLVTAANPWPRYDHIESCVAVH